MNAGLSKENLEEQGLVWLREQWIKAHSHDGAMIFMKCRMLPRMSGAVGVGEEKSPATRLESLYIHTKPVFAVTL